MCVGVYAKCVWEDLVFLILARYSKLTVSLLWNCFSRSPYGFRVAIGGVWIGGVWIGGVWIG